MGFRLAGRRIGVLGMMIVLLAVLIQTVWAALVLDSASFTCSSVTFSFSNDSNPWAWDFAEVRVTNVDTATEIYSGGVTPYGDDSPYTVNFPTQPGGSNLRLDLQVDTRIVSAAAACTNAGHQVPLLPSGSAPQCHDNRINRYNCGPVAIYPVATDAGYDLVVYQITPTGQGVFLFSVSAGDLAALPSHPAAPVLVAADPNGFAALYWLPSNEYQIVAGPDDEGKMFKFIFTEFPGEEPRLITYMAGQE